MILIDINALNVNINKLKYYLKEEQLTIETNNKEKLEISFSAKYMLEAIKTLNEDEILLLLNSDIKPLIIKSLTDESLIQLILPIKTY